MATVHGKLKGVLDTDFIGGTVDIALCGYGSRSPACRGIGSENGSYYTSQSLGIGPTQPGNEFSVALTGNDLIEPPGTYYTVTFRDPNGDIMQCNAYLFLGDNDYDLTNTDPFDPVLPMPPLPPLIVSQLLIIPPSATPNFPGDQFTAWGLNMTQDVTASTLSGIMAGNLYTFIITQGGGGNWKFTWPSNVLDPTPVNPTPGGLTVQTFVAIANNGPLFPIAGGVWYP
jgi:hypothetical protein